MHEHTNHIHLTENKKKADKSAKQAAGILHKVATMIDEDAYCPNIIQQVDAVIGLLTRVKKELLVGHLNHCLETGMKENKEKTVEELLAIYKLSK